MATRSKGRDTKKKKQRSRGTAASSVPAIPAPHDAVGQPGKPEPGTYPLNPAGPIKRLYAWFIDFGLIILMMAMLNTATGGKVASPDAAAQDIVLFLAYFIVPTGIWGKTAGKWVAGIVVSYAAFLLGIAWIVFDSKHRGWHDSIAGTYVVHDPGAGAPIFGRLWRRLK